MLTLRIGDNLKKRMGFDKNIPTANAIVNTDNINSIVEYCYEDIFGNKSIVRIEDIFNLNKKKNIDDEIEEIELSSGEENDENTKNKSPAEDIDYKKVIYNNLENIIKSENTFIIDELIIAPATIKKLIDDSEKILKENNLERKYFQLLDCRKSEFEKKKEEKDADSNPFPFCEAFANRDKRLAWIELMKLKYTNCVDMELIGASLWKMKSIKDNNRYYNLLQIMNNAKKRNGAKVYDELEKSVLSL